MAYVSYNDYVSFYGGDLVTEEEFPALSILADDVIDAATRYKIVHAGGLNAFPAFVQTLVKKACAAQISYLADNGAGTIYLGGTPNFTVGKVSVGGDMDKDGAQSAISPAVMMYLEQTGLLERGVAVC